MLTVNKLIPQGQGLARALLNRAASLSLVWDTRQKSRFNAVDSLGRELGVFLPRGTVVRGGDVLVVEDGSLVQVTATPQPVLVVRVAPEGTAFDLTRAAYHLGNRHVPLALLPDRLLLEPDHVLAEMLRMMGLAVEEALEAFEPEGGAYGASGSGGHGHGHAGGHSHSHGADAHDHHGHAHDHSHDGGHGHAHGDDHTH